MNLHTKNSIYDTLNTENSVYDTTHVHRAELCWGHTRTQQRQVTGGENTADDKKAAEAIALAAAEECRTFSVLQSAQSSVQQMGVGGEKEGGEGGG